MSMFGDASKKTLILGGWLVAAVVAACAESDDAQILCGDGTTLVDAVCVPTASDAGSPVSPMEDGGNPAPTFAFGGIGAVAPAASTRLLAVWQPPTGVDPTKVHYEVFVGEAAPLAYDRPRVVTEPGLTHVVIEGLEPGRLYLVGVRAVTDGVRDANTATKSASTVVDNAAPLFQGVTSARPSGSGSVELSWAPAQDNLSPPEAISYVVYVGISGFPKLDVPTLVTEPGATRVVVPRLDRPKAAYTFVVRARDAADNLDANTTSVFTPAGADTVAPTFGGCISARTESAGEVLLAWNEASDDATRPAGIRYRVYAGSGSTVDRKAPLAEILGQTSVLVTGLSPNTTYTFACHAVDASDNEEANPVVRFARTTDDPNKPLFAGLKTIDFDPEHRTANLAWDAATDLESPADRIVYDVYVGEAAASSAGDFFPDFSKPPFLTTAAGATTVALEGLPSNRRLSILVRARDQGGNQDANAAHFVVLSEISYSIDIQPIWDRLCAVVGCHVPGNPTGGLILTRGFSWGQMVNVNSIFAAQNPAEFQKRVTPSKPDESWLSLKLEPTAYPGVTLRGAQMPAAETNSVMPADEKALVRAWIASGAKNN